MNLEDRLRKLLVEWSAQGLTREIDWVKSRLDKPGHKSSYDFSSNDYLGLAQDSSVRLAIERGLSEFGNGATSSRLIAGSHSVFKNLEYQLAEWKQKESALYLSSGYQTNISLLSTIAGPNDHILFDRLAHASLIDGIKLSGAKSRSFRHNDLNDLAKKLDKISQKKSSESLTFVVTEGIFSMDGDFGRLKEIAELKESFPFNLIVDEAHGIGVVGECGRGLSSQQGIDQEVDIMMGTCGKALGISGGFICGSKLLIKWLQQKCRGWVYSTAPPPFIVSGLLEAIDIVKSSKGDELRNRLRENISFANRAFFGSESKNKSLSPIIPYIIGDNLKVLQIQKKLKKDGYNVGAIRYPSVAKNTSRLRITINANHSHSSINNLAELLRSI